MTYSEAVQQQIDEIMDTFPFASVAAWMKHAGWRWGDDHVPEEPEIRVRARLMLRDAAFGSPHHTAGFITTCDKGTDKEGPWVRLNLTFGYSSITDGTSYTA